MEKCNICEELFEEADLTTVTPSQYLGQTYPNITSFCPTCFQRFLVKAKEIYDNEEDGKKDNLRNFVNS